MAIPWSRSATGFDDLWVDETEVIPDILETMFTRQRNHMEDYAEINPEANLKPEQYGQIDDPRVQAALREFAGYHVEELYEAINNLKNKPWKQTFKKTDQEAFLEELADAWHFFIEFHILAGIDPLTIFKEYFKKSLINDNRKANNY